MTRFYTIAESCAFPPEFLEETPGFMVVGIATFSPTKFPGMMPVKTAAGRMLKQRMKHLVVNDVTQNIFRNARRIQKRAHSDRAVHGIVVRQPDSARPHPPADGPDFNLVAEIARIQLIIDFAQRVIFPFVRAHNFPTSQEFARSNRAGDSGIGAKGRINTQRLPLRLPAQNLAGKNHNDCLQHCAGRTAAMIADAHRPLIRFAPDRVCQPDVRIKRGFNLFGAENW